MNVVPMKAPAEEPTNLTSSFARAKARELSMDSKNVHLTNHAKQRMEERKINLKQVLNCLENGIVHDFPYKNVHGNWQFDINYKTAGNAIKVGVAIDWPNDLIILTAI